MNNNVSPKYIGFDITHIFGEADGLVDSDAEKQKLFYWLRAIANGW